MSSASDNINTSSQVGAMQSTVTENTQDLDPDTIGAFVGEADKPTEAERATSNDIITKTDAADQFSATSTPADQKPEETSDKVVDHTAVVKAEICDPTTEQLYRYKRRFQIWRVKAFLLPLLTNLIYLR